MPLMLHGPALASRFGKQALMHPTARASLSIHFIPPAFDSIRPSCLFHANPTHLSQYKAHFISAPSFRSITGLHLPSPARLVIFRGIHFHQKIVKRNPNVAVLRTCQRCLKIQGRGKCHNRI
jgi:hypothetical protein